MKRPRAPELWIAAFVVCATLVFRLPFVVAVKQTPQKSFMPDSKTYEQPAQTLLTLGEFRTNPAAPPNIHRTPAFPLFLAMIEIFSSSPLVIVLVQVILALLNALLVTWVTYYLAQRMSIEVSARARVPALLAGFFFATDLLSSGYTCLILTEHLYGILLTGITTLIVFSTQFSHSSFNSQASSLKSEKSFRDSHSILHTPHLLLAGLVTSINTLVRPIGLLLAFAHLPYLWSTCRKIKQRPQCCVPTVPQPHLWRSAALLLLSSLLFPALWTVRNGVLTGAYTISDIGSVNLYFYRAASVIAETEGRSFAEVQKDFKNKIAKQIADLHLSESQRLQLLNQRATKILLTHPSLVIKQACIGLLTMLFGPGKALFEHFWGASNSALIWTMMGWSELHLFIVYLLAALYAFRGRQLERWLFLATIAYFCLLSAGPEAYSRFRVPFMPLLCIMAGLGVQAALQRTGNHEPSNT